MKEDSVFFSTIHLELNVRITPKTTQALYRLEQMSDIVDFCYKQYSF